MDYVKAAAYWEEKESQGNQMERGLLLPELEKFIRQHNTCALATGCGEFVRCTPIEYNYVHERFWILTEGGLKFRALEHNKNVCLAIYDPYSGFQKLGGMQVMGHAELVEPWTKEYLELLSVKQLSVENMKKLPHVLSLLKITPTDRKSVV